MEFDVHVQIVLKVVRERLVFARLLFTKNGNQAKLHVERRYMARPSKNDRISQDSINIRASLHMY